MSISIDIDKAQSQLKDLVHRLAPGEEVVITENHKPVARLVSEPEPTVRARPAPGLLKGAITYMAPDFNEPLDDLPRQVV